MIVGTANACAFARTIQGVSNGASLSRLRRGKLHEHIDHLLVGDLAEIIIVQADGPEGLVLFEAYDVICFGA
jgi:hypothetical protein